MTGSERLLHIDFETFSECDLKTAGAAVYAAHPSTLILCMAFSFDMDEPQLWVPGEPFPREVFEHMASGGAINAHNSSFEYYITNNVLCRMDLELTHETTKG